MNSERFDHQFSELVNAFVAIATPDAMVAFLHDLCTTAELGAMAQRFEVAGLVGEGISYQEISRLTGASTATVTRVAHALKYGEGGYGTVLNEEFS
jgi:TrpR-related protein YerC/YecD